VEGDARGLSRHAPIGSRRAMFARRVWQGLDPRVPSPDDAVNRSAFTIW
jgi:hypothetical protein